MHRLLRRAVAEGPSRERWRDELVHLVRAHRRAEAETLTPDVVAAAGPGAAAAAAELARTDADLDRLVDALATTSVAGPEIADVGDRLRQVLETHAGTLDRRVLEPLEAAVPRREIRRLGGEYVTRRDEQLAAAGEADSTPRRLDLSRAELYELARKAGIAGRSAMSRRDLIAELQRRQPSG